jgi:hypothetical protein
MLAIPSLPNSLFCLAAHPAMLAIAAMTTRWPTIGSAWSLKHSLSHFGQSRPFYYVPLRQRSVRSRRKIHVSITPFPPFSPELPDVGLPHGPSVLVSYTLPSHAAPGAVTSVQRRTLERPLLYMIRLLPRSHLLRRLLTQSPLDIED